MVPDSVLGGCFDSSGADGAEVLDFAILFDYSRCVFAATIGEGVISEKS